MSGLSLTCCTGPENVFTKNKKTFHFGQLENVANTRNVFNRIGEWFVCRVKCVGGGESVLRGLWKGGVREREREREREIECV